MTEFPLLIALSVSTYSYYSQVKPVKLFMDYIWKQWKYLDKGKK